MTNQQLVVPLAGDEPAVLILPQPLTPEALCLLEQRLAGSLAMLRRDICSAADDPGGIEYESWMEHYVEGKIHSRRSYG